MAKEGFDKRIVFYEDIHNIKPEDEKALIEAINPKPHEKILDAFCGYGAITKNCLEKEPKSDLWLNDESEVQIKRARENLPGVPVNHFILGHFLNVPFPKEHFDKVVIKMGLHEVPKEEQIEVARKVYQILKPKGKLIVWDIMLQEENQKTVQDIIRKKDELAGFDMLVRERYFFTEDEFLEIMKTAGFSATIPHHVIHYKFSSRKRLESEFHNDKRILDKLNQFIRKIFSEKLKKIGGYQDFGEDIQCNICKKIYVMTK